MSGEIKTHENKWNRGSGIKLLLTERHDKISLYESIIMIIGVPKIHARKFLNDSPSPKITKFGKLNDN